MDLRNKMNHENSQSRAPEEKMLKHTGAKPQIPSLRSCAFRAVGRARGSEHIPKTVMGEQFLL